MPKKILLAVPPAMLEQIDYIALAESRTRSDLVREALRRYIASFAKDRFTTPATTTVIPFPTPANPTVQATSNGDTTTTIRETAPAFLG